MRTPHDHRAATPPATPPAETAPLPLPSDPTDPAPLTGRAAGPPPTPSAGGPHRTTGVAVVVIVGSVMSVLDMTIVNVALHRLSEAFHAPLATIQWAASAYTLALAAVIPASAWAMGRFGAKRTYLGALILFSLGSLLAACAWSAGSLIAFRAVQGLGGGLLMPVGMAMVMRTADPARLGRVMALLGLPIIVGPVAGPVLGGWLVDSVSWQWIFLVNLPVGAVALLLAAKLLHSDAPGDPSTAPRLDVPGLLTLSPGLALLLYGLTRAGEGGSFTAPDALLPTLAGAALVTAFARRALTTREPLLDLRLLRDRTFGAGILTLALFTCGYFGSMLLAPMYWQQARGMSATAAGLLGAPTGLTVGLVMQIASRRVDKVSPRHLIRTGIATGALGMALTALQAGSPEAAPWRFVAASVVMGIGAGMVLMPTMTTASRTLPKFRLTAASTILSINSQIGASIGTALLSITLTTTTFRTTYAVAALLLALSLLPASRLPSRHP
ncbi:DHA2 family efflux MFS transporter permease subunit [Streptomyces sp. NBC_01264]|uniref:DHA2 family efflux MFS transporter permease subunit n=1 Tax=Streptomyces sp. NBC_01264 TaxID=2903804 RepID=UPI002257118D|nr:DHA2 family efflux MFS transporter permease subunit [Streptomyces sp. NBC_01264]MCX4780132.1 DHA2 family efflux MFS transporter permease subunit [Streptomyces sp. NBC_01264]